MTDKEASKTKEIAAFLFVVGGVSAMIAMLSALSLPFIGELAPKTFAPLLALPFWQFWLESFVMMFILLSVLLGFSIMASGDGKQ